jgi:hypothetical protein
MDFFPECRPRQPKASVYHHGQGIWYAKLFCGSCGKEGGFVPESMLSANFAFYLCDPCSEKLGDLEGHYKIADEIFWQKVKEAQLEEDGRDLTAQEVVEALKDNTHYMAKLATERDSYLKRSRT